MSAILLLSYKFNNDFADWMPKSQVLLASLAPFLLDDEIENVKIDRTLQINLQRYLTEFEVLLILNYDLFLLFTSEPND